MNEIHFIVEKAPEGGFTARAVGADIFTEADDLPGLHAQVEDAVHCHFGEGARPTRVRLHLAREDEGGPGGPIGVPPAPTFVNLVFAGSSGEPFWGEDRTHEHDLLRT